MTVAEFVEPLRDDPIFHVLDFGSGMAPISGEARDFYELTSGRDVLTDQELSGGQRFVTAAAAVVPVLPGRGARAALDMLGGLKRSASSGAKTDLSQGGEFLDDALRTPVPQTPFRDNSLSHIFRPHHNLVDNPANRRLIQAVADDAANFVGTNQFGTQIFSRIQPDGSQIWVYVREGKIFDAGRNLVPRTLP